MEHNELIHLALEHGATNAAVISTDKIVLSAEFRKLCASNQCGYYNRCWMCPPFIGEIDDLMAQVRGFSHGLLYQTVYPLEDSFDIEGMFEASHTHSRLSRSLGKLLMPLLNAGALHLSCGGCHVCKTCAKQEDKPCRCPEEALSSMEGYGVDVRNTALAAGLKYINGPETVTYFGMILFHA